MPVYPTGFSSVAVVPCSHCNGNDQGPEAGICHRNRFGMNTRDNPACERCIDAYHKKQGLLGSLVRDVVLGVTGGLHQIPCSYCEGKGYVKV